MKITLLDFPGCIHEPCTAFATPLYEQLSQGRYDWPASILRLTSFKAWETAHGTARKRSHRAHRLGYTARRIERADHRTDIFKINTSAPTRQGRPMEAAYLEPPTHTRLPDYPCPRHRIDQWGVFYGSRLVAYLVLYVSGDMAMVSQILGHADHLPSDVMYLLVATAFKATLETAGPVTAFYNRHDSGTDGLRFFKERLGFQPARVEWAL